MTKFRTKNLLLVVLSIVFAFALISFVATKSAGAQDYTITSEDLQVVSSAEIRANGDIKDGIRFTALVSNEAHAKLNTGDVLHAGIIVARNVMSVEDLSFDLAEDEFIDVIARNWDESKDTTNQKGFNAVITQIPDYAVNYPLTARAYIKFANGTYVYSTQATTRSIAQVASDLLAKDDGTLTKSVKDIYCGYIDKVTSVIKVNGEEVADNTEIVLDHAGSFNVTVEPANLVPTITVDNNEAFSVNNGVVTGFRAVNASPVQIVLGTKIVNLSVTVNKFVDNDREDGVIVDFNEAGYVDYLSRSNSYGLSDVSDKVLLGEDAISKGASTGIAGYTFATYDTFYIEMPETVDLTEKLGLYINLKFRYYPTSRTFEDTQVPASTFSVGFLNANKETLCTIANGVNANVSNGSALAPALTFGAITPMETSGWYTLCLSKENIEKYFNIGGGISYISFVRFGQQSGLDFYIDEIGYISADENFVDTNVASDKILADFDEIGYINNVSSSKTLSVLAPATATDTVPNGALVAKASAECVPLDIKFNKTLVLDSTIDGIYIRMKTNCRSLYLGLLKTDGTHYKGTGAEYSINKNFSAISANPAKQLGDWYTYYFTKDMLIKQCGVTAESEIGGIRLYSHYGGYINYEIDEIGTYNYADLTDDTLDTNVVADFNDDVYGGLISSDKIYRDAATYNTLLLTQTEYEGVGATSGVLLYATNDYVQSGKINLPKAINCAEAKYIYITLNSTVKAPSSIAFYFNDSNSSISLKDVVVSSGDTSIINGWTTLYLDTQKIINKGADAVIESIRLYLPACSKIYIDEIGIVTADRIVEDNNLEENTLADFDETLYICNSSWTTTYGEYTAFVDSTHADYATIGATSGCLKYHLISYSKLYTNFQKGVKISETNGIILRLYASKDVSGSNFRIALGTDGTYGAYMMPGLTGGAWVDLVITPDMLLEAGYDLDATYNSVHFNSADPAYDLYIDSISIAPLA